MQATLAAIVPLAPRALARRRNMTVQRAAAASSAVQTNASGDAALAVRLTAGDSKELEQLWSGVTTLILDCDGVLWRGNELMPGTVEALQHFRRQGKRLLFLTNNSSKSRRQYLAKFELLGIQAAKEEVVPTSYAAAAYLRSIGFTQRAFVLGTEGMGHEMEEAGIAYQTWQDLCSSSSSSSSGNAASNGADGNGGTIGSGGNGSGNNGGGDSNGSCAAELERAWTSDGFAGLQLDPSIGAVVVGWCPSFSYAKLCVASAMLRELPGVHFVATNMDEADNMGNRRMMPGTGCIVKSIETATNRVAFNVGKGGPWLLPFLCSTHNVRPEEAVIVGDRLDTDIALGRQGGLLTVLPLTGVTTEEALEAAAPGELPHFVIPNLAALAGIHAA